MGFLRRLFGIDGSETRVMTQTISEPPVQDKVALSNNEVVNALYRRFAKGSNIEDIVAAASEFRTSGVWSELFEMLKPKVAPRPGVTYVSTPRAETQQWIAFQLLNDQENYAYHEYLSWIRGHRANIDANWIRMILTHVAATAGKEAVRDECRSLAATL